MPKFPEIQNITNVPGFVIEPDNPNDKRVLVNDQERNNDIEFNTIVRVGQYLSDLTSGKVGTTHSNKMTIDRSVVERGIINQATGRLPVLGDTTNSSKFTPRINLDENSDETLRNPKPASIGYKTTWTKGENNNGLVDGHSMLKNIELDQNNEITNTPLKEITSAVLNNNRFTSDNKLNSDVTAGSNQTPKNGFNPTIRLPNPDEKNESLGNYNRGVVDTTYNNLAKIGLILSLRGTGEVGSTEDDYDPLSTGAELKAILPSPVQLGVVKQDIENLKSGDVLKRMSDNEVDSILTSTTKSWGAMNNVYDPFDGITASGTPILAFSLILTMLAATELISFATQLISPGKPINSPTRHSDGRYVFGKWHTEFPPNMAANSSFGPTVNFEFPPEVGTILGIKPTQYPFELALQKGTYLFFGIERSVSDVVGAAVGAAVSTIGLGSTVEETPTAPGYNAVFCRAVMRSTQTIVDSMKAIGTSPNFIAGAKNFLAIFEVLKNSKLISAINVFTQLGDLALSQASAYEVTRDNIKYSSLIDYKDENAADATIVKSKMQSANKLSWAGNRTPSMFLMPSTVFGMSLAIQQKSGQKGMGGPGFTAMPAEVLSKNQTLLVEQSEDQTVNRLPSKGENPSDEKLNVQLLEETLEAEYVPFYFHDIRTNEIISFHAFLNSLTEDFSPSWESVDGYGRIDQVSIYKSTARKLGLSFWVVSTGHADFKDMWVKLNKLVTMVYPQYTKGRRVSPENFNFTMPFSQIPSASPIVRLRIGDLIRSNYSRFNLSRIFGFADGDTKINDQNIEFTVSQDDYNAAVKKIKDIKQAPWSDGSVKFSMRVDGANVAANNGTSVGMPIPMSGNNDKPAPTPFRIPANLLPYFNLIAKSEFTPGAEATGLNVSIGASIAGGSGPTQDTNKAGIFSIKPMTQDEIIQNYNLGTRQAAQIKREIDTYSIVDNSTAATSVDGKANITDIDFIFPVAWIGIQPAEQARLLAEAGLTGSSLEIESVMNFMNPKNNAIVRSFEETGGMGLACKIDNLSFDWKDQTMWETVAPGEKAPNRVKVTMQITAIHDISPGIDHLGYNRAPVWPVGPMNSKIDRNG